MNDITTILEVAAMFLTRIGLPIMALVTMGMIIERWQTKREAELVTAQKPTAEVVPMDEQKETSSKKQDQAA
jgi:hypothetical protein